MESADEVDPLMSIGMFSRSSLVSVKALRSYHEQGLLVPDSVDGSTGYRSYRVSQLGDAVIIKRLRDLDVPLRDIAEILHARDPDVTRKVIGQHEHDMRAKLAQVTHIVSELQQTLERPSLHTPVHIRHEAEVHALSYSGIVQAADYASFLNVAYAKLFPAIQMSEAVALGGGSARYPAMVDTEDEPIQAYVPIAAPVALAATLRESGITCEVIPADTCAVATHSGGYDTISDTYRQLGAWVARNAISSERPIREHYVVSTDPATFELLPDDQLRTEICWPISSTNPTSPSPSPTGETS